MERLRGIVQRRPLVAAAGLSALLCASKALAQTPDTPSPAPAAEPSASPAELVAARELFQRGTEDADAGRFAEALEKFKRVAAVKETIGKQGDHAIGKVSACLEQGETSFCGGAIDDHGGSVDELAQGRGDLAIGYPVPL